MTMDYGLWTMDHGPWTMDYGPWTGNHNSVVLFLTNGQYVCVNIYITIYMAMDYGLWTMDHGLWTMDHVLGTIILWSFF